VRAGPLVALALVLGGCGSPGADLFVAHRTGSVRGAELTVRAVDDGEVVCNGTRHPLSSGMLIDARVLARDLAGPARSGLSLPPAPGSVLAYAIRTADGTVRFSDDSAHQPAVLRRAAFLVRRLAVGPCGLPR
jgi:hypothetical protein